MCLQPIVYRDEQAVGLAHVQLGGGQIRSTADKQHDDRDAGTISLFFRAIRVEFGLVCNVQVGCHAWTACRVQIVGSSAFCVRSNQWQHCFGCGGNTPLARVRCGCGRGRTRRV